jgi:hypothetical protein
MSRKKAVHQSAMSRLLGVSLDVLIECLSLVLNFLGTLCKSRLGEYGDDFPEEWQKANEELMHPVRVIKRDPQGIAPVRARRFYAVAVGCRPGIYDNQLEAANQVNGYAGNFHRSFKTREEAEFYLRRQQARYQGD